ncbi:WD repeat-containing protein 90 [Hondaea fermentalgiana]|uniref:WD repeat-containing protein 90 n=1 Tax=Hondaea fermentalgiana TaxID=2315210 RepID=A0A2R5G5K0_9STRA|nr:WD repeat-containing protein 90 [Hondaea fermentalgiana]|eukprot:GBG26317.1 WD repeat-containing protein 90 [Hondaea fermentalgiana]
MATASSIWQRPFVDVFKLVGLSTGSWANCEREGNVKQTLDKTIGKNVVRITGAVATANKLVIPGKQHQAGLGLTGSFVYVQVRPLPHQLFTIIVEVLCKDGSATRITLSNMFRVPSRRGARILVPLDLADDWYTIGLDVPFLLERFKDPARPSEYWCLKSISVFAGVQIRNVFTAETPYRSTPDLADDSEMANLEALPTALQMSRSNPNLVIWAPAVPHNISYSSATSKPQRPAPVPSVPALRPDPVMKLHTYVGHSYALESARPLWSGDGKHIIYASASNIIMGNVENPHRQQRILLGHTARVNCLALDPEGSMLASSQEGRNPVIRLWNTTSCKCISVIAASSGGGLRSLDFSADGSFLCAVGRDEHNRTQIYVWKVSGLQSNASGRATMSTASMTTVQQGSAQDSRISLVARQTSEFDIVRIRFSPYDSFQLVSCGRENIRFWRIRNRHMSGTPVVLNEFARKAVFSDLAFESDFGSATAGSSAIGGGTTSFDKRVFVATNLGTVAAVHYERRTVLCIYRLHDGPIHALTVNEGFCVTASEDQHVRVWPLDFADFFLEARHESPVGAVDVSPDGLKILTSSTAGVLGVLDVATHSHTVKLRAHGSTVSCVSFRAGPHGENEMASASSDGTVRVWSVPGCEQMYEFRSDEDEALCCAYHPDKNQNLLICGYKSGTLRVFDVQGTALVYEYKQHAAAARGVGMHAEGICAITLSEDGHICVYDSAEYFQPTKMIALEDGVAPASSKTEARRWTPKCLAMDPRGRLAAAVHPFRPEIVLVATDSQRQLVDFEIVLRIKRTANSSRTSGRLPLFEAIIFSSSGEEIFATTTDNRIVKYRILHGAEQGWDAMLVRDAHSMHPASVSALALSPYGADYMATAGSDNMVQIWDARMRGTTPTLQKFIGHASEVRDANFSLDGRFLATVGSEQAMLLWEFFGQPSEGPFAPTAIMAETEVEGEQEETGATAQTLLEPDAASTRHHAENKSARAVRRHPLCELGYAGDLVPAQCSATQVVADQILGVNTTSTSVMAWHPETGLLVYSCGRSVVFTDLGSQRQQLFANHESTVSAVTLGASGCLFASGAGVATAAGAAAAGRQGKSAEVVIYKLALSETGHDVSVAHVLVGHLHGGVQAIQFSANETRLASLGAAGNGMICIWDVRLGTLESSHRLVDGLGFDLLWVSADTIVSTGASGQLAFWRVPSSGAEGEINLATLHQTSRLGQEGADLTRIAKAPKWLTRAHGAEMVMALGDAHGHVRVIALPERVELARWQAAEDEITALVWCDKHLIVGVRSGVVVLWDVGEQYPDEGQIPAHVFSYKDAVLDMCWEGLDGLVLTAGASCVYTNVQDQRLVPLVRGPPDAIEDLSVSADGSLLVSCGGKNEASSSTVRLWEPNTLETFAQVSVAEDGIAIRSATLVAPSGAPPKLCALACSDGSIRVVNISSSLLVSCVQVLGGVDALVSVCQVGDQLVAASTRGAVLAISVDLASGALDTSSLYMVCDSGDQGSEDTHVCLSSDARVPNVVAVVGAGGQLQVFSTAQSGRAEELLASAELAFKFVGFSWGDEDRLVCATAHSVAYIDVGGEKIVLSAEVTLSDEERVTALAGDYIGTNFGRVLRLDASSMEMQVLFDAHGSPVSSLSGNPKHGLLLSAAGQELVKHSVPK